MTMLQKIVYNWSLPILFLPSVSTFGDDALEKRIMTEYPAALDKLQSRSNTMHGKAHYHLFVNAPDRPAEDEDQNFAFAFAPGSAKISRTVVKPRKVVPQNEGTDSQFLYGVNPIYSFTLTKKNLTNRLC